MKFKKMKTKKKVIKEGSYVSAAENEGLYDRMSDLLSLASALTGEELDSPEEALEFLESYDSAEPEVVDELISQIEELIDDIDAVEAEAYFDEEDEEEYMGENYKPKKKVIRLKESDIKRIVKRVISEENNNTKKPKKY